MKFMFTMKVVKLLLYECGGVVYMNMLGALRKYKEFAFGWYAGGCKKCRGDLSDRWYFYVVCFPLCAVGVEDLCGCWMFVCVKKNDQYEGVQNAFEVDMFIEDLLGLEWELGACVYLFILFIR